MNVLAERAKAYLKGCKYKGTTFHGVELQEFDKEELMKIVEEIVEVGMQLMSGFNRRRKQ